MDFERLVAAHGDLVYGMCRGSFDPAGPAPIRGFVATIARRHLVDHHRRETARARVAQAYVEMKGLLASLSALPETAPAPPLRVVPLGSAAHRPRAPTRGPDQSLTWGDDVAEGVRARITDAYGQDHSLSLNKSMFVDDDAVDDREVEIAAPPHKP